jgi:hypothetical protein
MLEAARTANFTRDTADSIFNNLLAMVSLFCFFLKCFAIDCLRSLECENYGVAGHKATLLASHLFLCRGSHERNGNPRNCGTMYAK